MARCNCNGQVCGCRIVAGDGIEVAGSGGPTDPIVVSATGGGGGGESGFAPGDLKAVATAGVPGGWLLCNGQAVSRTSFADLFAAIGVVYGAGNGTTTFNVPDFRDRVPVGVSGTKGLGTSGGAETINLTASQLPAHAHAIDHNHASFNSGTGGNHRHELDMSNADGTNNGQVRKGGAAAGSHNDAVQNTGSHDHAIDVPAYAGASGNGPGSAQPVSVVQPYRAINWLIKT